MERNWGEGVESERGQCAVLEAGGRGAAAGGCGSAAVPFNNMAEGLAGAEAPPPWCPSPAGPAAGSSLCWPGGCGEGRARCPGCLSSPLPPRWCVLPEPSPALPVVYFTAAPPGGYAAVGTQAVGLSLLSSWGNLWLLPGSAGVVPGKSRYVSSQRVKGRLQAAQRREEA